ncbi:MAG: TIGR02266 family protein [Polyangiales bacterium]
MTSDDSAPNAEEDHDSAVGDRRGNARIPIALRVEYKRVNSFFADYTRNISKGGTFIATARPLPIGTEFVFELSVPDLPEPLRLKGVVEWRVEAPESDAEQPAGMGIRFRYETTDEREKVHAVVEALAVAKLGPVVGKKLLDPSG